MSHIRTQVRDEFETLLATVTEFGSRITSQQVYPVAKADLPMAVISLPREDIEARTLMMPRVLARTQKVFVRVYCAAAADVVDALDALCLKVEQALFANENTLTLNGKAKLITLQSVTIEHNATGELRWAVAVHEIEVQVMALESNPATEL